MPRVTLASATTSSSATVELTPSRAPALHRSPALPAQPGLMGFPTRNRTGEVGCHVPPHPETARPCLFGTKILLLRGGRMRSNVRRGLVIAKSHSMRASIIGIPLTLLVGMVCTASAPADPLFAAPFLSFDVGDNPISAAIADLNADGRPDLATTNDGSTTVSVLLGKGDGSFGARTDFGTGSAPYSVAIGDLDGDGKPDLVTANLGAGTVSVL